MGKVKIGIVGCGGIAGWKHMPSLSKLGNVELAAFCDIIIERAQDAKAKYGSENAGVYTDYRELLADKSIEVVHVLTPNYKHAEISIAALAAGKHVMCEKPMATTSAEAHAMVEAAKKYGKKLTIGYQSRSNPVYQYAHNLVKSGALGEIYYLRAPALRRRGVPTWGSFLSMEKQGGGPMIDIGTHSIDAALYIIGNYDVESVSGSVNRKLIENAQCNSFGARWKNEDYEVEDSAIGFIKFKNGCTMIVEASWLMNIEKEGHPLYCGTIGGIEISDGTIKVNGERDGKLYVDEITPGPEAREFYHDEKLNAEEYEAKQWIDSIVNDTEPLVKPWEAAVVTDIIEAIYKSAATGKTIQFK